jgi:hypothetical protein
MSIRNAMMLAGLFVMFALAAASGIYDHRYQKYRHGNVKATFDNGRSGTVVSFVPFDLWVTINTEPTPAEREVWLAQQFARTDMDTSNPAIRDWIEKGSTSFRVWPWAWRWNIKSWSADAGYDTSGRLDP